MNTNKPLERRTFSFEIRAEEGENGEKIITGRPIVYEKTTDIGPFDEVIARGALDGADLTDVRFLVNHNTEMIPLARSRRNNGNSTMLLSPDFEGLAIRVRLDVENNVDARALYSAVSRGDITGMSFMFTVNEATWSDVDSEHPTRRVDKFDRIIELSACTFPAYEDTEINARSLAAALESARAALESARKEAEKRSEVETSANTELILLKEKIKLK